MRFVVAVHFHPDWPFLDGTVIEAMAASGRYRSQFETGTSNGGLTAYAGGDRWRWESRLFRGRYDNTPPASRPVYGAVHTGKGQGPAPRFGSAYLQLHADVLPRATFCYPDSVFEPECVTDAAGVADLLGKMEADALDPLDQYVEAHVHGGLRFKDDVDAVVLDPCFRGTSTEGTARELGCEVEFHSGFAVSTDTLDAHYRGSDAVALACKLGEKLTPDIIGAAARSRQHDPQTVKQVWHLLARYGQSSS